MSTSSELRAKARAALGGQIFATEWLFTLLVCFVSTMATGPVAMIPVIGIAASIVLTGPIMVGLNSHTLKRVRGENADFMDILNGFKDDFAGNFLLGFMMNLFILLWSLLFIIPGIIKTYAYSMAYYIKNDHPEYTWKECLKASEEMMKGHKWRLFCLQFSFIGWIIVGAFCFGIGTYWVSAYSNTAVAAFYDELKAQG